MPATNVKTRWIGGDLYFYDKAGDEILQHYRHLNAEHLKGQAEMADSVFGGSRDGRISGPVHTR